MAQPSTRQELIDYCKRKLGAPVLEINVADEQIDDLVDDAIQFFQERHFDGVYAAFFKYKITASDISRGTAVVGSSNVVGIATTTATTTIVGTATTFSYTENSNYIQLPPNVIGVNKIFTFDGANTTRGMFSLKYQMFLNDIYFLGATELLNFAMVKTYLEDLDFLLNTQKQIRFNKRQDRLYLDIDWGVVKENDYFIIDCYSTLDPNDYARVYNDSFIKPYLTSLIKRQWGQNMMKFTGVKLPGGVELNGRQMYDDAQKELDMLMEKMSNTYELPPYDMIGWTMLNPFFLQGSKSEQGLIQDLINEQLRMYGVEVHYLPRKYITEKTIIREVIESSFDFAYPIEAYIENFDGYGDNTTILSKFGIQALNELTIVISKERFEEYIAPLIKGQSNIKLSTRPKEGDLIYFPLGDRLFEIKFVEHEQPFYQLQQNYVYTLKCELFRYEDEDINTSIDFIDDNISGSGISTISLGVTQKLTMIGAGVTATAAVVSLVSGGIRFFTVTNRGGGYTSAPRVAISSAPSGGVTGIGSATMIGGIVVCAENVNPAARSVQSVEVINPGAGYTIAPQVLFFGDGVGAAATATIGNNIVGIITITNAGGGYVGIPTITFTGSATVSAAATAIVSAGGSITQIRITNAGLGYTTSPIITIANPPQIVGVGTFIFNELVTGSTSGTTARVRSWSVVTNVLEVASVSGSFAPGETIVGATSSASRKLRTIDNFAVQDGYSDNSDIEIEAEDIIDFSNTNPFGMP